MPTKSGSNNRILILVLIALLFIGCAGPVRHMREISDEQAGYAPSPDEALVVFMRPSGFGSAIQSSVFEIIGNDPVLIGIIAAKKKVAYNVEPGEHLFMVIGENADFLEANVQAGKTYYALVTPRMGVWKARFSLQPIHKYTPEADDLNGWIQDCRWVEKTIDSDQWAITHMPSIQSKKAKYMETWLQRPENQRPTLRLEDGFN